MPPPRPAATCSPEPPPCRLLPAAAVAKNLNVQTPDRVPGEIDWPAVGERIAYAGDTLEIPPAEVHGR